MYATQTAHAQSRDAVTETYLDVQKFIYSIVHQFVRQYGGEFADLCADANIGFMDAVNKWDASKAAFTTYLRIRIWAVLIDRRRKELSRNARCGRINMDLTTVGNRDNSFSLDKFTEELSEDGRVMAEAAVRNPDIVSKAGLSRHFKQMGWNQSRIQSAFDEVREEMSISMFRAEW